MKAPSTILKISLMASALLLLQACATVPTETSLTASSQQSDSSEILHRVKPNERLGAIASRYTGSAANWLSIARYNGITNPNGLRAGSMIVIPNSLALPQNRKSDTNTANEQETRAANVYRSNKTSNTTNTSAKKRSSRQKSNEVVLAPVKTNRSFNLNPITKPNLVNQSYSKYPAHKLQIVGSYTPKGIYRQPANYSTLVMRAAPGTFFEVEYLANDWYKIITENGVGYLREDDGKIVPASTQL